MVDDLVPRRGARVVWCDDGEGLAARAAERMSALGYEDVAWLDGGIAAWEAAGFRVYSGVHVPSKAFAEVVEHEAGTPWISVEELQALIDRKADIAIYDSRSFEEYHNNSIPTADQRARGGAGLSLRRSHAVARYHGHRQLRRPHAQHHRGAIADQRRRAQQSRVAEGRHHGLAPRRASKWCMGRREGRPTSVRTDCSPQRGRCTGCGALRHRAYRQAYARDMARRGSASAASTSWTCARPRNTRPAICAVRARRRAASLCRKPTRIWRPGAPASCWSTTTASAQP